MTKKYACLECAFESNDSTEIQSHVISEHFNQWDHITVTE